MKQPTRMLFEEIKMNILQASKAARACQSGYESALRADNISELLMVVYNHLHWCIKNNVLDFRIFDYACERAIDKLDVSGCNLAGVKFPEKLQSLAVRWCNLAGVKFPEKLQSLDVRGCNLAGVKFPEKLQSLDVNGCVLSGITLPNNKGIKITR